MPPPPQHPDFCHAALFYAGDDGYVDGLVPFIRGGLEAGEPVLVMVPGAKFDLLRETLGADAGDVQFADMTEVGANPARIIPAWSEFVSRRSEPGNRLRGIGEPIWAGRTSEELVECQHHEALLNLAFGAGAPMDLVCPYDERALDRAVVEDALHSHPVVLAGGSFRESSAYEGVEEAAHPLRKPLPPAPPSAASLRFDAATLQGARDWVAMRGADAGLGAKRCEELVLAVSELASNSVRHGGGSGILRIWLEDDTLVAEVSDGGQIDSALAGREPPAPGQVGGHGLWVVNQLADLMQMRIFAGGSVVRVHLHRD
jgi:anti-sigma regulatory factor (Ser/Thr protein kinase)